MNNQALWDAIMHGIEKEVESPNQLNIWFKDAKLKPVNEHELVIFVQNEFAADWIKRFYAKTIEKIATVILNKPVNITISHNNRASLSLNQ